MTGPNPNEVFGQIVRLAMTAARRKADAPEPPDRFDQALAALALTAGLVAICWPQGRKVPVAISTGAEFARHVWRRRSWFLPPEPHQP